jgi:hypothetical protein
MLNMKSFFDAICLYENISLTKLAERLHITVPAMYRKASGSAEKVALGEFENMVHGAGYRVRVELINEEGKVLFTMDSDPEHPLMSQEKVDSLRANRRRSPDSGFMSKDHPRGKQKTKE